MGTSSSNRGQSGKTPLVPSWLDDDGSSGLPNNSQSPERGNPQQENKPQQTDPKRFSMPRSNFTRFVNSGGTGSGNLRRAASSYVRNSAGSSHNATMRLGSARGSTARLVSVVGGFARGGVSATAQQFHLGDIIGKSAKDVFLHIMDFVCPDGGNTDEGIARSAYIEALSAMPDWENKQIETLTPPEFLAFTEIYMADVIEHKLVNDIGNKLFSLPDDIASIENIEAQMKDFIRNTVSDAVSKLNVDIKNIEQNQAHSIVDSVYTAAYDLLASEEV